MSIDSHTFGGSKASETLALLLNTKYPRLVGKVGRYYHKYTADLTSMVYSWKHFTPNNGGCLVELMELHKHKKFSKIKHSSLPEEIKNYLLNVMSVSFRMKHRVIKNLLKQK